MSAEPGAAQSEVDKIAALSGIWNGFSAAADPSKDPTQWTNTIINFIADPLYPGMLKISGRGISQFQGQNINFGLSGKIDSHTHAFELYKTHTGRFTHTIVFNGDIYPDAEPPTMNGGFASLDLFKHPSKGNIELKRVSPSVPSAAPFVAPFVAAAAADPNQPGSSGSFGGSRKSRQKRRRSHRSRRTRSRRSGRSRKSRRTNRRKRTRHNR